MKERCLLTFGLMHVKINDLLFTSPQFGFLLLGLPSAVS